MRSVFVRAASIPLLPMPRTHRHPRFLQAFSLILQLFTRVCTCVCVHASVCAYGCLRGQRDQAEKKCHSPISTEKCLACERGLWTPSQVFFTHPFFLSSAFIHFPRFPCFLPSFALLSVLSILCPFLSLLSSHSSLVFLLPSFFYSFVLPPRSLSQS